MTDADLQQALARRDAPAGFSSRVLERVRARQEPVAEREPSSGTPPRPRLRGWIAAGLALAASLLVTVGVMREDAQRRETSGQRAAQDLEVALQIASETLQHVQIKVTHAGEPQ